MSISNKITQTLKFGERFQTFQSAFVYFVQNSRNSTMASEHEIKYETLSEKLSKNEVILIDVREPEELKDYGKIPGSVNIPVDQIEDAFSLPYDLFKSKYGFERPDPEISEIVLSCKSGLRAMTAYEKLRPLGFSKAHVYTGSFTDWVKKGGALEKL